MGGVGRDSTSGRNGAATAGRARRVASLPPGLQRMLASVGDGPRHATGPPATGVTRASRVSDAAPGSGVRGRPVPQADAGRGGPAGSNASPPADPGADVGPGPGPGGRRRTGATGTADQGSPARDDTAGARAHSGAAAQNGAWGRSAGPGVVTDVDQEAYYRSLKVAELRDRCRKGRLKVSGRKEELILRLLEPQKSIHS